MPKAAAEDYRASLPTLALPAGVAEQRHVSLRDLLFGSPRLLELVGRNLPARPALLAELADLLEMSPRALAQALLPHALPAMVSREGLEALAAQVGATAQLPVCLSGHLGAG